MASSAPTSVVRYGYCFLPVSRREFESPNGEVMVRCRACMPGAINRTGVCADEWPLQIWVRCHADVAPL